MRDLVKSEQMIGRLKLVLAAAMLVSLGYSVYASGGAILRDLRAGYADGSR